MSGISSPGTKHGSEYGPDDIPHIKPAALLAALSTFKPLDENSSPVEKQIQMGRFFKQFRGVLTAQGLTEDLMKSAYIHHIHSQLKDKAPEALQHDDRLLELKAKLRQVEKEQDAIVKRIIEVKHLVTSNATKIAEQNETLTRLETQKSDNAEAETVLRVQQAEVVNEAVQYKKYLRHLVNYAELNEILLAELTRLVPTHIREVVLNVADPANQHASSLSSNFGARAIIDPHAPIVPLLDIFKKPSIAMHPVLVKPASDLTRWLVFIDTWSNEIGITSVGQMQDYANQLSIKDDTTRFMPNYKFSEWIIKHCLRFELLKLTSWELKPMQEIILLMNLVNSPDVERFKVTVNNLCQEINVPGYDVTSEYIRLQISKLRAVDDAYWLQEGKLVEQVDCNFTRKVANTQGVKMAAHGGGNASSKSPIICTFCKKPNHKKPQCFKWLKLNPKAVSAASIKKLDFSSIVCWWCNRPGHRENECESKKLGTAQVGSKKSTAASGAANSKVKRVKVNGQDIPLDDDAIDISIVELSEQVAICTVSESELAIHDSGSQLHCFPTAPLTFQPIESMSQVFLTFGDKKTLPVDQIGIVGTGSITRNSVVCSGMSKTLLSTGQLADSGLVSIFTKSGVYVIKDYKLNVPKKHIVAYAPKVNGLYRMPVSQAIEMLTTM